MGSSTKIPVGPGDLIGGKYRVERRLGEGGMGVVLLATHETLKAPRAIKLLRSEIAESADASRRFLVEAQAASTLTGEHVARVLDVDRLPSGEPYLVMEHLGGLDLAAILAAHGPLPAGEAVHCLRQSCEALAEAHGRGLVHRDLKPANLFLTRRADGTPSIKVLDFGIAKVMTPEVDPARRTAAGTLLGTLQYMAPEQITASPDVDARADLWSLGVILYELVTGRVPFDSPSALQMFALVTEGAAPPPSDHGADLAPGLESLLLRCLEKDPAQRPPGAQALRALLAPFDEGPGLLAERLDEAPRPTGIASADVATVPSVKLGPVLPADTAPTVLPRPSTRRARRFGPAAVLLGVVLGAAGMAALRAASPAHSEERAPAPTPTSAASTRPALSLEPTVTSAPEAAPAPSGNATPSSSRPSEPAAPSGAAASKAPTPPAGAAKRSPAPSRAPRAPRPVIYDADGNPLPN
jgi:serine/threonine-protein kinase